MGWKGATRPEGSEGSPCGSLKSPIVVPAKAGIQSPFLLVHSNGNGSCFSTGWNGNHDNNRINACKQSQFLILRLVYVGEGLEPSRPFWRRPESINKK